MAQGRLTAGAVVNLKGDKQFANYIMFYHASGPLTEEQGDFDKNASIGVAWSKDLVKWCWPKISLSTMIVFQTYLSIWM